MGPFFSVMLAMLTLAELAVIEERLIRGLHLPLFVAIAMRVVAAGLALAAARLVLRRCRARWPDSMPGAQSIGTPPHDSIPEFSSGAPALTIDRGALYLVAKQRGEAYDTFVASFDRSANAWRDQSGDIVRRLHHGDRWLLLGEHREAIERVSKRMGDAFNACGH